MSPPTSPDLAAALDGTPIADLLPPRRTAEAERVEPPLTIVASASLGSSLHYLLLRDSRGVAYGVPALTSGDRLRRAAAGDGAAVALLRGTRTGLPAPLTVEMVGGQEIDARDDLPEQAIAVDQTNDLVLVGDTLLVKWLLHPATEPQPGSVRARQLHDVPEALPVRALIHVEAEGRRVLAATVVDALPDSDDGWTWAVDDVRALALGIPVPAESDAARDPRQWPAILGVITARIHLALAADGEGAATAHEAQAWHERAMRDAVNAELPAETVEAVRTAVAPLRESAGTPVIGIHADLHVGQVLRSRSTGDLRVIDFDGSPLATPEENLALQPAARDVAGMLASLDHVGRVVLHRTEGLDATACARVLDWIRSARADFLGGYRDELARAGRSDLLDERLIHPMLVQQECREYAYARRYLPHWRYVPDAALPPLLEEHPDGP